MNVTTTPAAGAVPDPPPPADPGAERPPTRRDGRAAAPRAPSLRQVVFQDLRPSELPERFRRDLKQLYRFYLDEERRAQLAAMGRIRRTFKLSAWLLKSLLSKLSPGRRLGLAAALVGAFLGRTSILGFTTDLRLWGIFILVVVVMLELKDKLLAKDEIQVAREVQLALLPQAHPQPEGWSIWSYMRPANDVGADLVDYLDLEGARLGIALGDVAGKGLGAALLTAKLQATLRALVPGSASLGDLGVRLNSILHRDGIDNRYVTLFYCEIDPATGRVRYLNAGHNPPYVMRLDGRIEELAASSVPLGMFPAAGCVEGTLDLGRGDILVAYSDGLTEAHNEAEEEFGPGRLRALLPLIRGLSARQAVERIISDVNAFLKTERPHDDLSLVVALRPAVPGEDAARPAPEAPPLAKSDG